MSREARRRRAVPGRSSPQPSGLTRRPPHKSPAASHAVDTVCGAGFQGVDLELDGAEALVLDIMVQPLAQLIVRHAQRRLLLLAELGGRRRQLPDVVVVKRDEP